MYMCSYRKQYLKNGSKLKKEKLTFMIWVNFLANLKDILDTWNLLSALSSPKEAINHSSLILNHRFAPFLTFLLTTPVLEGLAPQNLESGEWVPEAWKKKVLK